jgi:hypothetical protein
MRTDSLSECSEENQKTLQGEFVKKKVGQLVTPIQYFILASLFLMSGWTSSAVAQVGHTHSMPPQHNETTRDQQSKASVLINIVRQATERFKDVAQAQKEGYSLIFGCVSGDDAGAMGLHYLNGTLLNDVNQNGVFYADRPQIIIYEPTPNGGVRLLGADYLVFADAWNAKHPEGPPQLDGQSFHLFESPNRFALPAFYTLHVWAWKDNPNGAFVNWHPNVSCQSFTAPNQ